MKRGFIDFALRYRVALQHYLESKKGTHGHLQTASNLGRQAVSLGMKRFELAGIHGRAFAESEAVGSKKLLAVRAGAFFSGAIKPVDQGLFGSFGRQKQSSLDQSLRSQKRLRQRAHHVLKRQENERHNISRELHNEIAQTLLGLNVHLLSLKKAALGNAKGLKNQIASTQERVLESMESVLRLARQLDIHQHGKKEIPRLLRT